MQIYAIVPHAATEAAVVRKHTWVGLELTGYEGTVCKHLFEDICN